ncbi:hypothetical protein [Curtobacterium luteum]|uniref:Lipoprotein n=1 Tax=Curtobacterium luteum TaxID=33881 RepID=A0A175RXP6_9MICO|nr:hypothetical protein [Curtobacterium luteum]KTR08163.1 hypothetical protein NS184_06395 [Curtobacterium luteum]
MRLVSPVLTAVVLAGVLTGCSGPAPVDEAALHRWEVRERASDDALLFARISARADERSDVSKPSVSMTFPAPTKVRSIELACFGDGSMEGALQLRGGSTSRYISLEHAVSCADGRFRFDLSESERTGVEEVGFSAFRSTRDSAWTLHVRSDQD